MVFMRYWNFEVTGRLTYTASAAALALMAAILLEFYALWRALQPEDEQDSEYRKTLRWFMRSVAVLLVSVTIARSRQPESRHEARMCAAVLWIERAGSSEE